MGICQSGDQYHIQIERHMQSQNKADKIVKKLLLLGSGSSGKSTLFKQINQIHGKGFEQNVLNECKHVIRQNIVAGILTLLRKSQELYDRDNDYYKNLQIDMNDPQICNAIQLVVEFSTESFASDQLPPNDKLKELGDSIGFLWDLPATRSTFENRGNKFSFPDNMDYFFNKSEIIFGCNFEPNSEDALKTRVRTTGVVNELFHIKENIFHIFDVGGQRNERKKWIHQFENVTAVIFVAALNHYNAVLFEDEKKNAMHESIELFDEICNCKWFRSTELILFLNKNDLFRECLRDGHKLSKCFHINAGWEGDQWDDDNNNIDFPNYEKKDDIDSDNEYFEICYNISVEFIQNQYQKRNKFQTKLIFVHVTDATNYENIEKVFWDVQNMIIRSNLKRGGIV